MRYANFCSRCGAKAIGQFCGNCGSKIAVLENQPEAAEQGSSGPKIVGLKYHRIGMSMGKYLTVIPRDCGYDVVESRNDLPWPEVSVFGGFFFGIPQLLPKTAGAVPGAEAKALVPPSEEQIREVGGKLSLVKISQEEGDAFFKELTAAGILSWDGFSGSGTVPAGVFDAQDSFSLLGVYEDGRILRASGSNAYPERYADIMRIISGFFSRHVDYSSYCPTEFPNEIPKVLSVEIGNDLPGYDFYAQLDLFRSERKWRISLKDRKGVYTAPDTFLVDVGVLEETFADRLPFQRFISLLKQYDLGKLNQSEKAAEEAEQTGTTDGKAFSVYIPYSGDRTFRFSFGARDSEYGDFFRDFVKELLECHEELKDTSVL